jgi:hypothetical protein
VNMIVLLSFLQIVLRRFIIENAVKESNPDVGSSSIMHFGSLTSSYPMDVLFRSPPEIPLL